MFYKEDIGGSLDTEMLHKRQMNSTGKYATAFLNTGFVYVGM